MSYNLTPYEKNILENNKKFINKKNEKIDYKDKVCIKPWGYEFLSFESDKIGIWVLSINQNHKTSLHTHFNKDTTLIVLSGCIKLNLIDGYNIYSSMSIINIPKYKFHGIESISPNTMLMEIEIFSQFVSFSDKNDVLRINDMYKRDNTGYEKSVDVSYELDKYNYFYFNEGFCNNNLKILKQEKILINYNSIYILLEGTININGLYIREGSILNKEYLKYIDETVLILEITEPYYLENNKIIYNLEHLKYIVDNYKDEKIILTSGCYDILHKGHLHNLKTAKLLGDKLFVCLSNDEQIKKLKGTKRPINNYNDRIELFKTIQYVDYIILYDEQDIIKETTLDNIINIVKPLWWVKGNDYNIDSIIEKHPTANIKLIENIIDISTTKLINNINK